MYFVSLVSLPCACAEFHQVIDDLSSRSSLESCGQLPAAVLQDPRRISCGLRCQVRQAREWLYLWFVVRAAWVSSEVLTLVYRMDRHQLSGLRTQQSQISWPTVGHSRISAIQGQDIPLGNQRCGERLQLQRQFLTVPVPVSGDYNVELAAGDPDNYGKQKIRIEVWCSLVRHAPSTE